MLVASRRRDLGEAARVLQVLLLLVEAFQHHGLLDGWPRIMTFLGGESICIMAGDLMARAHLAVRCLLGGLAIGLLEEPMFLASMGF